MAQYKVVEIFESINGEGRRVGQLALFIRFQKCNLDCSYCDTKWANGDDADYVLMTEDEIYDKVLESKIQNITITGGEPLLQKDIYILLEKLSTNKNINIEIETNGSISLKEFSKIEYAPSFTMDYKLPNSNMEKLMKIENFSYLQKKDTVKFVASSIKDLEKAKEIIEKYSLINKCAIYFSPVYGKINLQDMVEFMKVHNLNGVTLQLQIHKIIWDPEAKGV